MATTTLPSTEQKKVFHSTIQKLQKSQALKEKLIPYLEENYPHLLKNEVRKRRIAECCNTATFRRYLESGNIQLVSSNFCKYDRICIACATKRAMRMIKKFSQGIEANNLWSKQWYYIVLTIKHNKGDKLSDLLHNLMKYKEKVARAYRNSKRSQQAKKSFFSQFDGMVMSVEIAHKGTNGRHPHINILCCSDTDVPIDQGKYRWDSKTNDTLLNERKALTNGSFIHNIRKINVVDQHFSRSGIGEVFKYAIKFSDLKLEQLAEVMAAQSAAQFRFFATYGIFRGWEMAKGCKYDGDWSEGVFFYDSYKGIYNTKY